MHNNRITHNDLKLDNIMSDKKNTKFVFIDFGLSCNNDKCNFPGSDLYMAPEIYNYIDNEFLSFDQSMKNDMWALGIVILKIALPPNAIKDFSIGVVQEFTPEFRRSKEYTSKFTTSYLINQYLPKVLPVYIQQVIDKYPNVTITINQHKISIELLLKSLLQIDPTKRNIIFSKNLFY
jgi:serine/threonine protein kinase